MSRLMVIALVVFGTICITRADTTANDIVEEVKSLRPFELK